jgi:hypothetical protein
MAACAGEVSGRPRGERSIVSKGRIDPLHHFPALRAGLLSNVLAGLIFSPPTERCDLIATSYILTRMRVRGTHPPRDGQDRDQGR